VYVTLFCVGGGGGGLFGRCPAVLVVPFATSRKEEQGHHQMQPLYFGINKIINLLSL
jgi:hypothetical protein